MVICDNWTTPMSQSTSAITPDVIREVEQEIEDERVPDPFLEIVELTEQFIERGWGVQTAKCSKNYDKVDQSMLCHVYNAMMVVVRIYELTDALDEDELRVLLALLAAHDYHKLRDEPDPENEFEVTTAETEELITETGLANYADGLSVEMFKAAIVMLHKKDKRSKVEEAPLSFDKYRPYLHFADAVASTPHPQAFTDLQRTYNLREALGDQYTLNHHEVKRPRGLTTNIIHQAVSDVICENDGYDMFTIYHEGCTYLGDQQCAELPITDEDIDDIYDRFIENLRTTHSAFQNADQMETAFPFDTRHRRYQITDRDFFFTSPDDIARTLVQKGVSDADNSSDLPDSVLEDLNTLENHLDCSFDRSRRIDGIARLIHTVHTELVPDIKPEDQSNLDVTCNLFTISTDMQERIETLRTADASLVEGEKHWPVKYLLAQDVIDRYYTGRSPSETADAIAETLVGVLNTYDAWETIDTDRTQDIHDEIQSFILYNVSIDGQRLIRATGGREEYDRNEQARGQKTCALCNYPTSVDPTEGFRLLKDYPDDLELTHHDGSTHQLQDAESLDGCSYCIPCQLDLALRFNRQEFDGEDRLYVHIMPDYFYTPLLWRIYRGVFDEYLSINTTETTELAKSVFESDAASGYQTWLQRTLDSTSGIDYVHDLDGAFRPDTGFGTHAISRKKPPGITETEELFVALAASTYAGVRVSISDSPLSYTRSSDFDTAVNLDDDFDLGTYTGSEIPLTDLQDVLGTIAAMLRLTDVTGHGEEYGPLEALDNAADLTPLPGALLLKKIATADSETAVDYVGEARYIDEQIVSGVLYDRGSGGSEWPMDITPSALVDPVETHHAADALAGAAWPFMTPDDTEMDTLCAPLDAAFEAVQDAIDDLGDEIAYSELRTRIEQDVAAALQLHYRNDGRHFRGRIAAFADAFVGQVLDGICDGRLASVSTLESTLRTAFYAAVLDLATTTLELDTQ